MAKNISQSFCLLGIFCHEVIFS